MVDLRARLVVPRDGGFLLGQRDPGDRLGYAGKEDAAVLLAGNVARLSGLQYTLWAENRRSVLVVLQGMDTSGKDGTIRHVMTGVDPQGCPVVSFKKPTERELDHGYLWRVQPHAPARGEIAIFNRSHYEDVLISYVHGVILDEERVRRFAHIRDWERYLADIGTTIVKCCLHISKDEQKRRLEERLADPAKRWKFSEQDVAERKLWDKYQRAYEEALAETSTAWGPWYVIPADRKWVRNLAVAEVLVEAMEEMRLELPKATIDPARIVIE